MDAGQLRQGTAQSFIICALLVLAFLVPAAPAQDAKPGELLPLRIASGCCDCVLPAPSPATKYYLVVGSLSRAPGPFKVRLRTATTPGPAAMPLDVPTADQKWRRQVEELHQRLDEARRRHPPFPDYHPASKPDTSPTRQRGDSTQRRTFYLFTREHDFQDPAGYTAVAAELRAVGRRCQVYVDSRQRDLVRQPVLDDIVHTFDEEIWPWARRNLGQVLDVDRDGRFTILLTGWLSKLCDGKVSLGGCVRGSDFDRDLAAPFGNQCDMMYLNTDLEAGPHLHTLLAHEYTHAVVFCEHVFGGYLPEEPNRDEEGWLNEALAHLVEDRHGYSWSNLDYRVSAFLNAPERYQLVIPDYYGSGLWRAPGNRGAAYLFLRWCSDRHGEGLARELVQSSLCGVTNLETATREQFADLFRRWTVALLADQSKLRGPLGSRFLAGPRLREVSLNGGQQEVQLAGTSAAYFLLHSPADRYARVTVTAEARDELQVSLVQLPESAGRLSLRVAPEERPGTVRIIVTAHDSGVTLEEAAWERLVTHPEAAEDTSYRAEEGRGSSVRCWFGPASLEAGESRTSPPLSLPAGEPVVFKVLATDRGGHHLAAWAVVP